MNRKAVCLPLVVVGAVLILVACGIAVYSVGLVRDQVTAGVSVMQIFEDYFFNWGVAILLMVIGAVAVGIGLRH